MDRLHWFWLILAAPFLLFPSAKFTPVMMVVPAIWIVHLLVEGYFTSNDPQTAFPITPLNVPLLIMAIMALISLWATFDISFSLEKIGGFVLGLGIYFSVIRLCVNGNQWGLTLLAFMGGGVGWTIISFFGMDYEVRFHIFAPLIRRIPKLLTDLPDADLGLHHNAVGGTMLWYIPLFLSLSLYLMATAIKGNQSNLFHMLRINKSGNATRDDHDIEKLSEAYQPGQGGLLKGVQNVLKPRWIFWLLGIIFILCLAFICLVFVLTQSRSSYLALTGTGLVAIFIILKPRWRWVLSILIFILILSFVLILSLGGGWENLIGEMGLSSQAGFSINTLQGRVEIWKRALNGIHDFPVTGMGMNTFRKVVHVLYPIQQIPPDEDFAHAHNVYLQTALDLGIPGMVAFISLNIISFWMLVRIWIVAGSLVSSYENVLSFFIYPKLNLEQVIVLGLGGGLLANLVFGMVDAISLGAKPGIFYWMLLGLIASLHQLVCKNTVESR